MSFISYYNEDSTQLEIDNISRIGTGLLSGGVLSINVDTTKFDITAGEGVFIDDDNTQNNIIWSAKTALTATYRTTNLISYIGIDDTGSVIQSSTKFTPSERRLYIDLGVLVHTSLTVLDAVNNLQYPLKNVVNQLHDVMDVLGIINVSGNIYTSYASDLRLSKSAGTLFQTGSNYSTDVKSPHTKTLSALSPLVFQYRLSNSVNYTGLTQSTIIPGLYESSSGVTTALGSSNPYSIQRIYSFVSNNVKIQFGQATYKTLADAQAAMNTELFTTEPSILLNGCFRAFLVVERSATNLSLSTSAYFFNVGKFGSSSPGAVGGTTTMQQAYNNTGTLTHITTTLIGGPVEIQKGSEVGTSNDLMIFKDSSGVQKASVNYLGSAIFGKTTSVDGGFIIGTNYANTSLTSPTATHLYLRSDGYRIDCYNNGVNTALACVTPDNFKIYSNLIQRMHVQHTGNYVAFQSNTATATLSIGPTNITGYINLDMNNNNISNVNTLTATSITNTTFNGTTINGSTINTSLLNMTGLLTVTTTGYAAIELIGTQGAFIDFSESAVDYSARIIRNDTANGNLEIIQTGTGVIQFKANGSTRMEISTGITVVGNIIASSNVYALGTTGNRWKEAWVIGGLLITSDLRLKKDILPLSLGLEFVNKLNPITFKWNDDVRIDETGNEYIETHTRGHIGLIAQDLHQAILDCNEDLYTTDLVSNEFYINPNSKDEYAVKYEMLTPILINAIKELTAENILLKSRLKVIEDLLNISN